MHTYGVRPYELFKWDYTLLCLFFTSTSPPPFDSLVVDIVLAKRCVYEFYLRLFQALCHGFVHTIFVCPWISIHSISMRFHLI